MARKRKHDTPTTTSQEGEPQYKKMRKVEAGASMTMAAPLWEQFKDKNVRKRYKKSTEKTKEEREAYKMWKRWRDEREAAAPEQDGGSLASVDQSVAVDQRNKRADEILQPSKCEVTGGQEEAGIEGKKSRKQKKREKLGEELKMQGKSQEEVDQAVAGAIRGQNKRRRRKSEGDGSEIETEASSSLAVSDAQAHDGAPPPIGNGDDMEIYDAMIDGNTTNAQSREKFSQSGKPQKIGAKSKKHSKDVVKRSEWAVSESTGGRMLDIDPIFSPNEEYVLIAYASHVTVYATSTSLPIRKLVTDSQRIESFALTSNTDHLLIGTSDGHVELWDWLEGERVQKWNLNQTLQLLQYVKGTVDEGITFLTSERKGDKWLIYMHALEDGTSELLTRHVFTHDRRLDYIFSFDEGRYVIMSSGYHVICGFQKDDVFTWRTVTSPEYISSIDVRRTKTSSKKSKVKFNLAIGGVKGAIHVYEDLLTKLMKNEEVKSRKLHWHRNVVMALKWSTDGAYLISGGQESTLVQWQLDSSRKDYLPHLGAPVENIVVSPSGSSYALHLAVNSTMVLSTAGLEPTFSVAGIQTPTMGVHHFPALITADLLSKPAKSTRTVAPACVCPSKPGQILLAVPSYSSFRTSTPSTFSSAFLQTIELESGAQLHRQAIARTNVTVMNMGPGGNMIEEPNVTQISCSQDGKWLATVDEWVPPKTDNAELAFDEQSETVEQATRREVYLKFWTWSDKTNVWELVSRIDKPHTLEYQRAARIVGLVSNPDATGFATLGEDGAIKAWSPVTRIRSGMEVKDAEGTLTTWKCRFSLSLPITPGPAKLAWAQDGSVIAVGSQSETMIYLVDALDGKIEKTIPGLHSAPLLSLAILERYLIILSHQLIVYDLVTDTPRFTISLDIPDAPLYMVLRYAHLAINPQNMTFAATIPVHAEEKELHGARLAVFDPRSSTPLLYQHSKTTITALLPAVTEMGFYALDSTAEVRTIAPSTPHEPVDFKALKELEIPEPKDNGLLSIFGTGAVKKSEEEDEEDDNRERRHITRSQWEKVYEPDPATKALPPIEVMFERTMQLIIGREGEVKG